MNKEHEFNPQSLTMLIGRELTTEEKTTINNYFANNASERAMLYDSVVTAYVIDTNVKPKEVVQEMVYNDVKEEPVKLNWFQKFCKWVKSLFTVSKGA